MFTTLRHIANVFFKPLHRKIDYVILSAMPEELEFFRIHFSHCPFEAIKVQGFTFMVYEYNNRKILLSHTGLGTTFASSVVTFICNYFFPTYILFSGTAGAIHSDLNLRDVIVAEKAFEAEIQGAFRILKGTPFESCLTHPLSETCFPPIYSADKELLEMMDSIHFSDIKIYKGTVVSSNAFPAPQELFNQIKNENPYAIDMETSALYQVAWLFNARVLAVRGVSNLLNHDGTDDKIIESDVKGSSEAAAKVVLKLLDALLLKYSLTKRRDQDKVTPKILKKVRIALEK